MNALSAGTGRYPKAPVRPPQTPDEVAQATFESYQRGSAGIRLYDYAVKSVDVEPSSVHPELMTYEMRDSTGGIVRGTYDPRTGRYGDAIRYRNDLELARYNTPAPRETIRPR